MGNSQSIGHTVQDGIQIYNKFKSEYEQQQYQQKPHYGGSGGIPPPPLAEHDSPEYQRLRQMAHEEAAQRNNCYEQSQRAYKSGDGAEAKTLSVQGHEHDQRMKDYNSRAADLVFREKNAGRPLTEMDLHGLFVHEAGEKVEEAMRRCQEQRLDHLVIIVGKGLHSPDHIAKLKPAILELVKRYNVRCEPNKPNPGCLYVEFGRGTGDMGWLDRFANEITQRHDQDACVVM